MRLVSPAAKLPPDGTGDASGKVILAGEHAVVHGRLAVAAPLPGAMRVSLWARGGEPGVRLYAPALGLSGEAVGALGADGARLQRALEAVLEAASVPWTGANAEGWDVAIDSALPAGAGLGSSAALGVALARAFAAAGRGSSDDAAVREVAMAGERVFHRDPSGVDVAVALRRGGVVRFRRAAAAEVADVPLARALRLVLAVAGPPADTGEMVAGVAARARRHERLYTWLFEGCERIAQAVLVALASGDVEALGALFDANQGLLSAMGVSTAGLERACHAARGAGAAGCKLTGAGGGGAVVAVVEDGVRAARVLEVWRADGFTAFEHELPACPVA